MDSRLNAGGFDSHQSYLACHNFFIFMVPIEDKCMWFMPICTVEVYMYVFPLTWITTILVALVHLYSKISSLFFHPLERIICILCWVQYENIYPSYDTPLWEHLMQCTQALIITLHARFLKFLSMLHLHGWTLRNQWLTGRSQM